MIGICEVIAMNLHIVGRNSDLQKDPNRILIDMLKSRWNQNGADDDQELKVMDGNNNNGVRFSDDWFNESSWYQVIVKHINTQVKSITLGARGYIEYNSYHAIHIFTKGKNARDKIWKLEKEIERIIATNTTNMSEGIQLVLLQDFKTIPVEDAYEDVEHSIMTVMLRYYKTTA